MPLAVAFALAAVISPTDPVAVSAIAKRVPIPRRLMRILAAVAAGITMSFVELSGRSMARTRIERTAVWNTIQFTLNGIMFVLLGEQLPAIVRNAVATVQESGHHSRWWLAVYAVAITAMLALLRFVWVWTSLRINLLRRRRSRRYVDAGNWRLILATSLAGVRGTITLAGVLSLPLLMSDGSAFPMRGLAIFLAAAVTVLSLVAASFGLPGLLKGLEVPPEPRARQQEDRARAAAATAAIESVKKTQQAILEETTADTVSLGRQGWIVGGRG